MAPEQIVRISLDTLFCCVCGVPRMSESRSPSIAHGDDSLYEVVSHLGAALMQADRDDDPIIIEHVRSAHRLALGLHRKASNQERTDA